MKALKDPDLYIRVAAIDALGAIGDVSALNALTELLVDESALIRAHAADAVAQITPQQAKAYQIRRYEKDLADSSRQVRTQAFAALASLSPEQSANYKKRLAIANLSDADESTRVMGAEALREVGDGDSVEALILAFNDPSRLVRSNAATALGGISARLGGDAITGAVDALIAALNDEQLSPAAINALIQIGAPATNALVISLESDSAATRAAAAAILGQLQPDKAHAYQVQRSMNDLKDPEVTVRAQAAVRLSELGDPAAAPVLVKALADQDNRVQQNAAIALGRVGEPAIDAVLPALRDGNPSVRWHAILAVKEIAAKLEANARLQPAIDPLAAALKDSDDSIRIAAAEALKRIGVSASQKIAALLNAEGATARAAAAALLTELEPDMAHAYQRIRYARDLKDRDPMVRSLAAQALGSVGNAETADALVAALKDADAAVRRNATNALAQIGESAITPLMNALNDEQPTARWHALMALGGIAERLEDAISMQPAVESIAALLRDPNKAVRAAAINTLGKIGRPAADTLIAMLGDADSVVRSGATKALGQMGDAATEPLAAALSNPKSAVRQNAAAALGMISPDTADWRQVARYINDLKDGDPIVRAAAAKMLGIMGGTRAVEPLISALADADYRVRLNAAEALGDLNDKRALDALELARKDQVKAVEEAAKNAIDRLKRLP
jgi:HEAT repeat protein